MSVPIQAACNMDDPAQFALWALVGLPGAGQQAPLILPVAIMEEWSKHLHRCGFRHHPDLQEVKYVPPATGTDWVSGVSGRWVSMDEALSPAETAPDTGDLTLGEKRALFERLRSELGEEEPEGSFVVPTSARVESEPPQEG